MYPFTSVESLGPGSRLEVAKGSDLLERLDLMGSCCMSPSRLEWAQMRLH